MEKEWTEERAQMVEQIEAVKAECAELQGKINEKKAGA